MSSTDAVLDEEEQTRAATHTDAARKGRSLSVLVAAPRGRRRLKRRR